MLLYSPPVFTGLVQDIGVVERADRENAEFHLRLRTRLATHLPVGSSVAVDGVCLTVTQRQKNTVSVTAVAETLTRSTVGRLGKGSRVNLEPALALGDSLGGHWVQGHVDTTGTICEISKIGESVETTIETPEFLRPYVVYKGSIAVDGVSLTVAAVDGRKFRVALVPHTLEKTTLSERKVGDAVNLEADMLAKYVENLLRPYASAKPSRVTVNFLKEHGFA